MIGRRCLACLVLSAVVMACQASPTPTTVPAIGEICPTHAERVYFASIPSSLDYMSRPVREIGQDLHRFEWDPTGDSWKAEIAPNLAKLKQYLADLEQINAPPPPSLAYLHERLLELSGMLRYVIDFIDSNLEPSGKDLASSYLSYGIDFMVSRIKNEVNVTC